MDDISTDCFHGKLERRSAEDRLDQSGKVGSFLLRESDRKSGSYVLSYLGRSGVNHFRITNVYGSYFIGGRKFDSLAALIDYYSHSCDLLTDERLLHPVAPAEPVSARERLFISILPYTKLAQSDELSFQKGDMFILQNDLGDGWLWCRDVRTGQSGMIFSHLVEEVSDNIEPNEIFPWFHARLSKSDAVNKLAEAGPGSFLVRPSDNSPGNYTLFYHVGSTIQRFLIIKNSENRYTMGGKCFDSLGQIIELYSSEQIIEGHTLQYPVTTSLSRADQLSESALSTSMRALQVKDKAQDVYNTVKMSREAAKRKQSSEVKGWLALKKGDIQKKWKSYFFVLNSRDRHLYYYDKPQQTKPKGLIDLSCSYLYKIHESLFEWPLCFQVIEKCLPCFANHFYIKVEDEQRNFENWIGALKKYTLPGQFSRKNYLTLTDEAIKNTSQRNENQNSKSDTFEEKRSLYMTLIEAHSLKVNQPYFVICFNNDLKIAKTQIKSAPIASFNEDSYFALEQLPDDVKTVSIYIYPGNKKVKSHTELAQVMIDLSKLKHDEQSDRWYEFHMPHSPEVSGVLRIRMYYTTDIIMNISEYAALEDLVCEPDAEIISIMGQACHRDHQVLARALSNIYKHKQSSTAILRSLVEREASLEPDTATLFRTSCLTTALIESYMRLLCQTALTKSLRDPIRRLLDDRICCELNPSRIDSHNTSSKACENLQNLLDLLDQLVSNIYDSIDYYPISVRYLFACLQRIVQAKWPNEPLIRTRVVSGFLFLRLICPTLLNPKQFRIVNETPSENAIRNLTLIAKCLQNLANLVETSKSSNSLAQSILSTLGNYATHSSSQSEPIYQADYSSHANSVLSFILSPQIESWMEVVNPFILKNKIGMVKFIDELCNVELSDLSMSENLSMDRNNNGVSSDPLESSSVYAQDLANIHTICENYRDKIEQLAGNSASAKKLLTILTILTQHKQYYLNLKRTSPTTVDSGVI